MLIEAIRTSRPKHCAAVRETYRYVEKGEERENNRVKEVAFWLRLVAADDDVGDGWW